MAFAGDFAPQGWALCQGQTLSISTYTALFSILGTTYGGNGTTNFNLPDLRGRTIVGAGQGPGLSPYVEGQQGGAEQVTLSQNQMPAHTHSAIAQNVKGTQASPSGGYPAVVFPASGSPLDAYAPGNTSPAPVALAPQTIGMAGGSAPVPTSAPYTCINYIIALQGVFPSRN